MGGRGGYFIVSKCCPVNARIKTGKGGEGIVRMGGIEAVCRGTIAGGMGLGTRWSPRARRGVVCGCTHVVIVPSSSPPVAVLIIVMGGSIKAGVVAV